MAEGIEIEFTENLEEVSPTYGGGDPKEGSSPPSQEAGAPSEAANTAQSEPKVERTVDPGEVRSAVFAGLEPGAAQAANNNLGLLMDVTVPIAVELGRSTMKIEEILGLSSGSVIELDKLVDEPVDLKVNGKLMARGEIVVVDDFFGIRVSEILDKDLGVS